MSRDDLSYAAIRSQFLHPEQNASFSIDTNNNSLSRTGSCRSRGSLAEAAADIQRALDNVLIEMKDTFLSFRKRFPIRPGFKGAYTLTLIRCGKKGCKICPHSIAWVRYDCMRKAGDNVLTDLQLSENARPPIPYSPKFTDEHAAVHSTILGYNGMASSINYNHPGRRTTIFWHPKKYKTLPSRFHQLKKHTDWYEDFAWYNNKIQELNKQRIMLGEFSRRIRMMHVSLLKNKKYQVLDQIF